MRKFGLFIGLGATLAAAAVMYTSAASADPQVPCSASRTTACQEPGYTGRENQYPPITPGARPPGLAVPVNQYPPITPGARPPSLAGPQVTMRRMLRVPIPKQLALLGGTRI